ncbi:hypothetical protein LCGC14_0842530 [marine sediment metagenome]|uniref:Uncharacterized protein n=1 Tax=marine sediment metagenome TaxID=412755 RepID=A0A0F9PCN3_9ZZZZ
MEIVEIIENYTAKLRDFKVKEAELNRLRDKHERLMEKYREAGYKLKYPHWIENYLTPLAKELIKHFPDADFDTMGPFGMDCETTISIHGEDGTLLAFLEFIPGNLDVGELFLRDYTIDNGLFSKGTIAEMNGANHPSIPIPQDATIEWFMEKIKYFQGTTKAWTSSKLA